jgi:mono/diheme cytochrome c family protein
MKRTALALLLASTTAQTMGCVAELSSASPGGSGGTTSLGGSRASGAVGGAPDSGNGSGGTTTLPPASTGGTSGVSTPIPGSGSATGTGGRTGTGGASAPIGGGAAGGAQGGGLAICTTDTVPATVQSMLDAKCQGCHGSSLLPGAISLRTFADLTGPSRTDPTRTAAAMMLSRIQSAAAPMPPAGGTPATAAEVAALRDWVNASYKAPCLGTTTTTTSGGTTGAGGATGIVLPPPPGPDPFAAGAICTSKTTANGGESATMAPGQACINCHRSGGGEEESEAPIFSIAGTLYPTGHEPNNCNGMNGTSGARIVITGADGTVLTLAPNSAGNFTSQARVRAPFRAKVTYQGRERLMIATQTSGDCNACHTQNGASMAPGRIVLP